MTRVSPAVYRRRRLVVFGTTGVVVTLLGSATIIGIAPLPPASITAVTATDLTNETAQLDIPQFGT
ncbi:hypothetical protein EBZ80_28180, partial [bacterium]|nr:hypothetical protein [bacterium]